MEYEPNQKPDPRVNQSSGSSAGSITLVIMAIALVVGAAFYFSNNWTSTPEGPQLTQNNTATPAPINEVPAAPAPATSPAPQKATPPADASATSP